jgi:hypothetical protein
MQYHLTTIGIVLILLALVHVFFPKYFHWEKELSALSLINQQMMKVHTFFIALTVCLMGLLCLTSANELITTSLGKKIALGFGIFWTIRLLVQFFGYSPELWRGKTFETLVHIAFIFLWVYLSAVFYWVGLN